MIIKEYTNEKSYPDKGYARTQITNEKTCDVMLFEIQNVERKSID